MHFSGRFLVLGEKKHWGRKNTPFQKTRPFYHHLKETWNKKEERMVWVFIKSRLSNVLGRKKIIREFDSIFSSLFFFKIHIFLLFMLKILKIPRRMKKKFQNFNSLMNDLCIFHDQCSVGVAIEGEEVLFYRKICSNVCKKRNY